MTELIVAVLTVNILTSEITISTVALLIIHGVVLDINFQTQARTCSTIIVTELITLLGNHILNHTRGKTTIQLKTLFF